MSLESGQLLERLETHRATGICGTGVLELVAGLYENHIIDASGQMKEKYREEGFPLARMKDGKQITFTQQDIREVQLAKAAIHSGIELLLEHAAFPWER